ncbi:hypothetical protein IKH83_00420 [Candidatus Saccharibacteria bacterium]|nr:hypothetical protein [Candidatus Saccharibacteria bacterium]
MKGKKSGGRRVYEAKCRAHDEAQEHRRRAQMATRKYSQALAAYGQKVLECRRKGLSKEESELETKADLANCELLREERDRAINRLKKYEYMHQH